MSSRLLFSSTVILTPKNRTKKKHLANICQLQPPHGAIPYTIGPPTTSRAIQNDGLLRSALFSSAPRGQTSSEVEGAGGDGTKQKAHRDGGWPSQGKDNTGQNIKE